MTNEASDQYWHSSPDLSSAGFGGIGYIGIELAAPAYVLCVKHNDGTGIGAAGGEPLFLEACTANCNAPAAAPFVDRRSGLWSAITHVESISTGVASGGRRFGEYTAATGGGGGETWTRVLQIADSNGYVVDLGL
jgi:hypothetical protein